MRFLRLIVFFGALVFSLALAVIIGWRLSDWALVIIVGVLAGVAGSIPAALLLTGFILRRARALPAEPPAEPRVIVVPAPAPLTAPSPAPAWPAPARAPRPFTVIGGEDELNAG